MPDHGDLDRSSTLTWLAGMSHDLRQPLHALGLFLDALERRVTPGEGEKILAKARDAATIVGRSFNALIDLIRLEAGSLTPEPARIALDELLAQLADEAAGVEIALAPSGVHVHGDRRLIAHILAALLANQTDFAPARIELRAQRRADRVAVELTCRGCGQGAAKWAILQGAPKERVAANELDLYVAKRLADLIGATIAVAPLPDGGVTLSLALPAVA